MKAARPLLAGLLLAGAGLLFWSLAGTRQAPAVDFLLTDGRTVSLESLRGRPVLIAFWSSTCPACLAEMPYLAGLYREFAPDGLQLIGVAMPYDRPDVVLEIIKRHELPYPVSFDLQSRVVRAFGDVRVTPTTLLLSPSGEIVLNRTGKLDMAQVRSLLQEMLGKT